MNHYNSKKCTCMGMAEIASLVTSYLANQQKFSSFRRNKGIKTLIGEEADARVSGRSQTSDLKTSR